MKNQFIKQNLFIIHDDKDQKFIQSYETIVAEIKGSKIICNGTYSKTTTAHINHIAQIMDKQVVRSYEKPEFVKLPVGTKIK